MFLLVVLFYVLAIPTTSWKLQTFKLPNRLIAKSICAAALTFNGAQCFAMAEVSSNGKRVFEQSCSVCHAGGGTIIPFAKTLFQGDLTSAGYDTQEKIIEIVNKGSKNGMMMGFGPSVDSKGSVVPGRLSDVETADVAEYVLMQAKSDWK